MEALSIIDRCGRDNFRAESGLLYFAKRNEMKICGLQNESLWFAK